MSTTKEKVGSAADEFFFAAESDLVEAITARRAGGDLETSFENAAEAFYKMLAAHELGGGYSPLTRLPYAREMVRKTPAVAKALRERKPYQRAAVP